MPHIIEYIDAIARRKQRGVLWVQFGPNAETIIAKATGVKKEASWPPERYDYHADPKRQAFLAWLEEQQINWQPCGPVANENGFGSYQGGVYIDIPFDESDERYRRVRDRLENPDGTMRDGRIVFLYWPLERAMENAHHDEPGYWEKWAEDF